jgi:pimeloyl-ACP methyl ester carboxylesterase
MEVFENKLTEFALGRRRKFASVEDLAAEYRKSRATERWVAGVHELMARSVLRKSPDGDGYTLVCAPENEAAIYAEALTLNLWPRASAFGGPVKLIGADPDLKGAPATAQTNQALGVENGYDYAFVPGTGHLLQIENPAECARLVEEFVAKWGLRRQ